MGETDDGKIQAKIERLRKAALYEGPHRWIPFTEKLEEEKHKEREQNKLMTTWTEFDFFTGGFISQELTIVSGMEGNGKSLFCRSLAHQFLKQDIPVGYIHYEGSFLDTFKPFEYDPRFKLYVPNKKEAGSPNWIIEQCYRFKAQHSGKIIILDHLHYIIDMSFKENMSLNIGGLLRNLIAEVAEGLDMSVILVAHQQGIDSKTEPGIQTIRDSSFLRQEPGLVIIVHRMPDQTSNKEAEKTYEEGYATIKIEKARRTGTYRKRLTFQKQGDWLNAI